MASAFTGGALFGGTNQTISGAVNNVADNQILNAGLNSILGGILGKPNPQINVRDYQHASNIFSSNQQLFMPKTKRWFHVYFDVNRAASSVVSTALGPLVNSGNIRWDATFNTVLGTYVKTVKLPGFKFKVENKNQYNRRSLNVTKIIYDPVSITFHDDSLSAVSSFWYGYYQYMNGDPSYIKPVIGESQGLPIPHEWQSSNNAASSIYSATDDFNNRFGLDTQIAGQAAFGRNQPFFNAIRIYQFTRVGDVSLGASTQAGAHYDEFVLVNPIITSFAHDNLMDYSNGDSATNTMDVEFETVLYNRGYVNDLASWTAIIDSNKFDPTPSPRGSIKPPGRLVSDLNAITATIAQAQQAKNLVSTISSGASVGQILTQSLNTGAHYGQTISVPGAPGGISLSNLGTAPNESIPISQQQTSLFTSGRTL